MYQCPIVPPGLHFAYQNVSQWYRELSKVSFISSAIWSASDDRGYECFYEYLVKNSEGGGASGREDTVKRKEVHCDFMYVLHTMMLHVFQDYCYSR